MFARDVMTTPVYFVAPDSTVAHARNLMVRHRISRLLVMEGPSLTGILTKKDIAYRLRQGEPSWRRRPLDRIPVGALATNHPLIATPDTGILAIARLFVEKTISSVPIVDRETIAGIVTKTDLMKSDLVRSLKGPVRDVMEDVVTVSRYHSLNHVVSRMRERNDKVLVIDEDGTLAGIITETNLAFFEDEPKMSGAIGKDVSIRRRQKSCGVQGPALMSVASVTAEDIMSGPVITCQPGTPIPEAIALMGSHHINSLVVMEENTPAGIIKRDDIIKEVAK